MSKDTIPMQTEWPRPGDTIISSVGVGADTVYTVARPIPDDVWQQVSVMDLKAGDTYKAVAPDGSGEIISRVTGRGTREVTDMRKMFGIRNLISYRDYGWRVYKKVR